jgi:hypothetical protein
MKYSHQLAMLHHSRPPIVIPNPTIIAVPVIGITATRLTIVFIYVEDIKFCYSSVLVLVKIETFNLIQTTPVGITVLVIQLTNPSLYRSHLILVHKMSIPPKRATPIIHPDKTPDINDPIYHCISCEKTLSSKCGFNTHLRRVHKINIPLKYKHKTNK